MPDYDYIIIGAGASGLMLAAAMADDAFFDSKSILVLDRSKKNTNDRTWCFWETGAGKFEDMVHTTWPKIHVAGEAIDKKSSIAPYTYKMVRGIDFYRSYLNKIAELPNIEFKIGTVQDIRVGQNGVVVVCENGNFKTRQVFDSRFDYAKLLEQSRYPVLQQHFLGWFVKTASPVFDVETASFMDFSIPQKGNTRFMYVLPFSTTEALVEYTLFSETVLQVSEYENAIKGYLSEKLHVNSYELTAVERGNIPMTCFNFAKENTDCTLKIGIAGGWAKPSTGYTFYNSSKKVRQLIAHLKKGKPLCKFEKKNRFWFYDLLLLDVLKQNNALGGSVFEALFKKLPPQLILRFLAEESALWQELRIIFSSPTWPFLRALLKRVF